MRSEGEEEAWDGVLTGFDGRWCEWDIVQLRELMQLHRMGGSAAQRRDSAASRWWLHVGLRSYQCGECAGRMGRPFLGPHR